MPGRIMVFNDDSDTLEMYEMALAYGGYTPFLYLQPYISQHDFEAVHPDLIILDWMYGREERGLSLLQQLRSYPSTSRLPVIVCTAGGTQMLEHHRQTFRDHDVTVISKPFELEDLFAAIVRQIDTPNPNGAV